MRALSAIRVVRSYTNDDVAPTPYVDGGAIFAPIVSRWFTLLQRIQFKSQAAVVATRVGLDQGFLTPIMVGVFFTSMSLLEGKGLDEAKKRLDTSYKSTLVRNWGVFVPVQIANFAVVPPHLRLVVVNVVSLFWNAYLSYANQQSQAAQPQQALKELTA